ncbi:MAG: sensor histidine kinase [Campylobacterota bacterium]|nr:sensor histidine kinase [Campylobacterota bacterium]
MKKVFIFLLFITHLLASTDSISYFEQKNISKNIDILKEKFIFIDSKKSNFGFNESIFWIKVKVFNNSTIDSKKVLSFPYTLLDYIDIYELKDNKLIKKREMGDLREYVNDGFFSEPSFFVNLQANEKKTFIFKVQTQGSMNIDLKILDYDSYIKDGVIKSQILMFYFGAVLIMLMYNFILYLYIRDKSYLYYIFFHFDYMLFTLAYSGLAFSYFWSSIPFLNNFAVPFFMSIGSTLAVVFAIDFLHIKANSKKIYKPLLMLAYFNVIATILIFILSYRLATLIVTLLSLFSVIVILGSSAYSYYISKNPNAKFFALAWGFLLLGIFTVNAKNLGLLPVNIFTTYAAFIGAFIELTLLSSALAYRYKLQNERIAQKDIALIRQSRHASMGEMIANIAHQWRQPLHRINLSLSVIDSVLQRDEVDKRVIDKKLKSSQENLQYMSNTIEDFTSYFRPDKFKENFRILEIVDNAKILLESRLKNIVIKIVKKNDDLVSGFRNEYLQVVLVILNNAIDNFVEKDIQNREIILSINSNTKYIWLDISDSGGGIKEENLEKVFDPYYTTKFKEMGTGIGLYMAKLLITESMHGELSALNSKDGANFRIKIERGGT